MTHLTAAYMAIGLITAPNQLQVCDHFGGGQLDLIDELVHYADYAWLLADAAFKFCGDSPGVPDYEISEQAGVWFGKQVLANAYGNTPNREDFCDQLRMMTFVFFKKVWDSPTGAQRIGLEDALGTVLLPQLYGSAA